MNRTILFVVILIFILLLGLGAVWYVYTRPIAITWDAGSEFPKPQYQPPIIPPGASTTAQPQVSPTSPDKPTDTRSWGERLRDQAVPDVPGVVWQIYRNKKYGFEMEYPVKWEINMESKNPHAVYSINFYSKDYSPYPPILALDIFSETLYEFASQNSSFYDRFKNQGMIPDATIHGIDSFIVSADARSDRVILWMIFEKDGHIYSFGESFEGQSEDVNKIIEHMIKTFRFF